MRWIAGLAVVAAFPATALAQAVVYPAAERQIASAVTPLPEPLQKGAKVLGYDSSGKLVTLRAGTNEMICLADNPKNPRFHVSCYHQSLEPFMSRGRELRAQNMKEDEVDSTRAREVRAKRLAMPEQPAALHQYFAARDSVDAVTGAVRGARYLYVVYTPYATYKTTGISEAPVPGGPWIMFPGTPFAHLMISPQNPVTVEIKQ
jgi:hypothetical protein